MEYYWNIKIFTDENWQGPLPYKCPKHPDSKVLRSWMQTYAVWDGVPRGLGWRTSPYRYQCNECGREISSPLEGE